MPAGGPLLLDHSHPVVRDYAALIRLQVLTPLAVLVHGATVLSAQFLTSPSFGCILDSHLTSISPSPTLLVIFWGALLASQVAFCVQLVMNKRDETKEIQIHGVGLPFVAINWLFAAWVVAFIFGSFIICTILAFTTVVVLVFVNVRLYTTYPASIQHSLDLFSLHTPLRLSLLLSLTFLLPHSFFLAIGHTWGPQNSNQYDMYQWEGSSVIFLSGFLALSIIVWKRDLVWAAGTMWLLVTITVTAPKTAPVAFMTFGFLAMIPLTTPILFLISFVCTRRQGAIRLEEGQASPPTQQASPPPVTPSSSIPKTNHSGLPSPPQWLRDSVQDIHSRYPHDKFVVLPRMTPATQDSPVSHVWKLKCIDCPGKMYNVGPGESLTNFEIHLRNRGHRAAVNQRI